MIKSRLRRFRERRQQTEAEPASAQIAPSGPKQPDPKPSDAAPSDAVEIPRGVRIATEWSWRFLIMAAAVAVLCFLIVQLRVIVVPVAVALLLTALIVPAVNGLARIGLPRGLAAGLTLVGVLIVIGGLLTLVGQQIASGFDDLASQVTTGIDQIHNWLQTGPLRISDAQFNSWFDQAREAISGSSEQLTQSALSFGSTLGHVLAGFFIVLFSTIFLLYQGEQIWQFVVRLFPRTAREAADGAGRSAWVSLTAFVRATVLVAFVDAVGIAAIALILRLPLAIPIGVLVFIASFIPVVGAVVSGVVAVLVALVVHGPLVALVMLGGVVLVQQLESHVLQPFLMGRLVRLHPLAIVLAIAAGSYLGGIVGTLLAVPLVAVLKGITSYLSGRASPVEEVEPARP
jgi:predicted PurR-regulated permease PerM